MFRFLKVGILLCVVLAETNTNAQQERRSNSYDNRSNSVIYGRSDSCDTGAVAAIVNERTRCETLSSSESAWSIKVNEICQNISDTNVQAACKGIQAAQAKNVLYGRSDSCDINSVVSVVNNRTNCNIFGDESVWSIKIDGKCENISDTTAIKACRAIQARSAPNVIFGRSDSCDMSVIEAVIDERTNCEVLSDTTSAWSMKVDGDCQNIADTNVRAACRGMQANSAKNVLYGRSDSCEPSSVLTIVNSRTDCSALGLTSVWSVKVDGVCKNISDTTAEKACKAIIYQSAPNLVFGRTDSCDMDQVEAIVTPRTQCRSLSNAQNGAWSIKVKGVCKNISDTTVGQACLGVQSEM